jgi:hypothetical protein
MATNVTFVEGTYTILSTQLPPAMLHCIAKIGLSGRQHNIKHLVVILVRRYDTSQKNGHNGNPS